MHQKVLESRYDPADCGEFTRFVMNKCIKFSSCTISYRHQPPQTSHLSTFPLHFHLCGDLVAVRYQRRLLHSKTLYGDGVMSADLQRRTRLLRDGEQFRVLNDIGKEPTVRR